MGHLHCSSNNRKNKYLTFTERIWIEVMYKDKKSTREISEAIGHSQRTVQRELKRGMVTQLDGSTWIYYETYSSDVAQNKHEERCAAKGPGLKIGHDHALCDYIEKQMLEEKWSPDVIIGRIKREKKKFATSICTKTLYRYLDQGLFVNISNKNLTYGKRKKSQNKNHDGPSYKNLKGRSIEERPQQVELREEAGHWEMDCVVGGKGKGREVILTLSERQSRTAKIIRLASKTQESVVAALDVMERKMGRKQFSEIFKSITVDNGVEFLNYGGIERSLRNKSRKRTIVYYAHPYSSWERGSNENMNRMIRRFIPKGTDIGSFSIKEIKRIENWLNNYPRKILNYRTPAEVYEMVA